jgi:hypothetical protein
MTRITNRDEGEKSLIPKIVKEIGLQKTRIVKLRRNHLKNLVLAAFYRKSSEGNAKLIGPSVLTKWKY